MTTQSFRIHSALAALLSALLITGCSKETEGSSGAGENIGTTSSGRGGGTIWGGGAQHGSDTSKTRNGSSQATNTSPR